MALASLSAGVAGAQEGTVEEGEEEEAVASATADAPAADLSAVVRGFYLDIGIAGGYMVVNDKLDAKHLPPDHAGLAGKSESLGGGSLFHLDIGVDVADSVAVRVIAGANFAATRRTDVVRDLSVFYGGLGLKLNYGLSERTFFSVGAAAGYAMADNRVDEAEKGALVLVDSGLEYYVHVRHFSVGANVFGVIPLSPMRAFVAAGPRIKYTF